MPERPGPSRTDDPPRFAGLGRSPLAVFLGVLATLLVLFLPGLPIASGHVVLEYAPKASVSSRVTVGPITAVANTAGAGACLSTQTGSVPFVANSARGSAVLVEPRGCPTRHLLVFLPALRFTNGLAVPAGHILRVKLDLQSMSGTTGMLRNVQLYVQQVGVGNPIRTAVHILIRAGAVVTGSTSFATLASPTTYGVGLRIVLNHLLVSSTANLVVIAYFELHDGGAVRSVVQERLAFSLTY